MPCVFVCLFFFYGFFYFALSILAAGLQYKKVTELRCTVFRLVLSCVSIGGFYGMFYFGLSLLATGLYNETDFIFLGVGLSVLVAGL